MDESGRGGLGAGFAPRLSLPLDAACSPWCCKLIALNRLVSDCFGCIFPVPWAVPLGQAFGKELSEHRVQCGPEHRAQIQLPSPLHCPQPPTSTDDPRSIPSFWLFQGDFTHWGWCVAPRSSARRGLTSSSQLALSTWISTPSFPNAEKETPGTTHLICWQH